MNGSLYYIIVEYIMDTMGIFLPFLLAFWSKHMIYGTIPMGFSLFLPSFSIHFDHWVCLGLFFGEGFQHFFNVQNFPRFINKFSTKKLVGGNSNIFYFHPIPGEDSHFD